MLDAAAGTLVKNDADKLDQRRARVQAECLGKHGKTAAGIAAKDIALADRADWRRRRRGHAIEFAGTAIRARRWKAA